jgi:hypothetical protein
VSDATIMTASFFLDQRLTTVVMVYQIQALISFISYVPANIFGVAA